MGAVKGVRWLGVWVLLGWGAIGSLGGLLGWGWLFKGLVRGCGAVKGGGGVRPLSHPLSPPFLSSWSDRKRSSAFHLLRTDQFSLCNPRSLSRSARLSPGTIKGGPVWLGLAERGFRTGTQAGSVSFLSLPGRWSRKKGRALNAP